MDISPDWTDTERLEVIATLACRLQTACNRPGAIRRTAFALANTILMVAGQSAEFLELNREQILRDLGESAA